MNFIQDSNNLILIIMFVCFVFIVLGLFVCFAIIRIEKYFKDLVDLQYKKYEEEHGKDKDVSVDKS